MRSKRTPKEKKAYTAGYLAGRLKNKEFRKQFNLRGRIHQDIKRQGYNRENKNEVRDKIISIVRNNQVKTILTLESPEFLFANELKDKKIFVYENTSKNFLVMKKTKPSNVVLFEGDVSQFHSLDKEVDCIYLDFCNTLKSNESTIYNLKREIQGCKIFAITLCLFPLNEYNFDGNYQFHIINAIQTLTGVPWKVLYGIAYKDKKHLPMLTIVFENPNFKSGGVN